MIEIDGSKGEGGGQILRTSVALSSLLMRPVKIHKIRAGRPKPGLKRQHIVGIELTAQLVKAETIGLEVGSETVEFRPTQRQAGEFTHDVGTAGAISLVLQAVLPTASLAPDKIGFRIRGGTDVAWSPPIEYLQHIFVPMLKLLGADIDIRIEKRGHYPKGGGRVVAKVKPSQGFKPVELLDFGELDNIKGVSHCVRLPRHIAERQASAAQQLIEKSGYSDVEIEIESYPKGSDPHLSAGSGIVLWAESKQGIRVGADSLGARGKRAEVVGEEAAKQLIRDLSTGKAIDSHLSDMLVPYLALAGGNSEIGITKISSHLKTNIWVVKQFLENEMNLSGGIGQPGRLSVSGVGFSVSD